MSNPVSVYIVSVTEIGPTGVPAPFGPSYLKVLCDVQGNGGVLFINEILYPGWRAKIDGNFTPLIRANYLFRAIIVPEGTHIVEMEFKPGCLVFDIARNYDKVLF